jgi:serine O-acetyltransferase
LCAFLWGRRIALPAYLVARIVFQHCIYKYGIEIAPRTQIGPGLLIGHFGGILISNAAKIGKNCNLSHEVTIGVTNRGERAGVPTLGDNVYIGPGAKIFGAITIGNNVAIGANAVVTRDVPDNAVVAGVPAKVISMRGSEGYIANTDYE